MPDLRSPAHWIDLTYGHCAPMPTQHTIPPGSAYEYHGKIGNKQVQHAMHQPRIRGLAPSAGVWLQTNETESSVVLWAHEAWEGLF